MFRLSPIGLLALPFLTLAGASHAGDPLILAQESGWQAVDADTMVVKGQLGRRETFEILTGPDGRHAIISLITGENGAYRVAGRWDYDAGWNATEALGYGSYDGQPVTIRQTKGTPIARIELERDGKTEVAEGPCDPDCFIDMAPSALPMFVMTRHYDRAAGGVQRFIWMGRALSFDTDLFDGQITMTQLDSITVPSPDGTEQAMDHFVFVETLTEMPRGTTHIGFNLWVDKENRPIAFATEGGTKGVRNSYAPAADDFVAVSALETLGFK